MNRAHCAVACGCETTVSISESSSGGARDQAVADRMDDLAEDRDVLGLHRERVERRVDRALKRVLDRNQRALDGPEVDRHHRVVDRRVGNRVEFVPGRRSEQRLLGPGALRPEVGDAHPLRRRASITGWSSTTIASAAARRPRARA